MPNKINLTIAQKGIVAILMVLLPILTTFLYHNYKMKQAFQNLVLEDLLAIADALEGQVYQFIETSKMQLADFASDGMIRDLLNGIQEGHAPNMDLLSNYLIQHKQPLAKGSLEIFITSLDGKIVGTTDNDCVGLDIHADPAFILGKAGAAITTSHTICKELPVIVISGPITDRTTGKLLGVIVKLLHLRELNNILNGELTREMGAISWNKGRRRTLEAYLVNRERVMITDSQFIPQAALRQKVDTFPVQEALQNNREIAAFYQNYRGVEVVGASMWIPSLKWTLLVEIDVAEILSPLQKMRRGAAITLAVVLVLSAAAFGLFIAPIIQRIRQLSQATEQISQGNYNMVLPVTIRDEIGRLIERFNHMAAEIVGRGSSLEAREKLLRAVIDNSHAVIYVKDLQGKYLLMNKRFMELFHLKFEEVFGKSDYDFFPKNIADIYHANDLEVVQAKTSLSFDESAFADGTVYSYISIKFPLFDQAGNIYATGGISTDITERKKLEERLQRAQQIGKIGCWERDIRNNSLFWSDEIYRIFGLSPQEFGASYESFLSFVHPDDRRLVETSLDAALYQKKPYAIAYRIVLKDGTEKHLHDQAVIVWDGDTPVRMTGTAQDITEHDRLEAQLRQSQKMDAVGQLAGGVAHDFNNVLTIIIGHAELLQIKMTKDERLHNHVAQILSAAAKAADLTRGLLAFSRKQLRNPKPANLNKIIQGMEKMVRRLIPENIEIRFLLAAKRLTIMADTMHIEQVILNLCANARDAMPNGGALVIESSLTDITDGFVATHGYGTPGKYALLSVTDTGIGMDQKTMKRLFEPFFTTKEVGKGTGLGLSIIYGIVKQHNGHIHVESQPGKGTVFMIYLPYLVTDAQEAKTGRFEAIKEGSETILLIEDNIPVMTVTKEILEEFGYKVIAAADGEEGIRKFKEFQDKIHLLILDVIMPKKNGREVYEEIQQLRPAMKVLFMSGYPSNILATAGISTQADFLSKPALPNVLLRKVREVLDR